MRATFKSISFALMVALTACEGVHVGGAENASYTLEVHDVTPELIAQLNVKNAPEAIPTPTKETVNEDVYKVGPGDVLFVKLAALSSRLEQSGDGVLFLTGLTSMPSRQIGQEVTRDGIIQVPVIGRVYAAGKTVRELNEEITSRILTLYKHPSVEVKLLEYNSQQAFITGEVNIPKHVPLNNSPIRVLELIEQAGGVKETADLHNASITRKDGAVVPLDLAALILKGDERYNILIKNDDVLHVPSNHLNKFFVFGEAVRPLQQFMRPDGKSLAEALNELSPNEITHDNEVYVIRGAATDEAIEAAARNSKEQGAYASALTHVDIYKVDLTNLAGYTLADRFELQPRDIVYLPAAGITRWNRFISQLLPGSVTSAVSSGSTAKTASQ